MNDIKDSWKFAEDGLHLQSYSADDSLEAWHEKRKLNYKKKEAQVNLLRECINGDFLDGLSPKQRGAFTLIYQRGMSLREASARLKCSTSATSKHLSRAISKLRSLIELAVGKTE